MIKGMPVRAVDDMIETILPTLKIRRIEASRVKTHDILGNLRATWPGRVYVSYLKRYGMVRWIAQWVWRKGYPIYANYISIFLLNRRLKRWRTLISLNEYAKNRGMSTCKLADAALVETPMPKVFPITDQGFLDSCQYQYNFPEIYVATVSNAMVYGGTNLILAGDEVVCHDLYDFKRDYTSEELHGRTLVDPKSHRIRWLLHDETPESVPMAATFVDACASNYAHWITEVLPRINLFCADKRFKDVPIVVNDGLHKNIMESLVLVAGADREVILLPIGRALVAEKLYITSVAGYVPFERRKNKLSGHSHGMFSPQAFENLHKHFKPLSQKAGKETWPEKIFLRRNSDARKVTNAAEMEDVLLTHGYTIVEPEKLTFMQQVNIFSNAKVIIAPTGAALANAVFCDSATKIGILISKHKDMSYGYWVSMLGAVNISVSYILGDIVDHHDYGVHGDFEISQLVMSDFLGYLEGK